MKLRRFGIVCVSAFMGTILAACSSKPQRSGPPPPVLSERPGQSGQSAPAPAPATSSSGPQLGTVGKYYDQDGPPLELPADLANRPDAQAKVETLSVTANRPYNIFGQPYVPMTTLTEFRQRGIGSWYGRMFHGRRTSSGEIYDMFAMTAAHPTLPIPSYARVTSVATGKQIIVRVNDRGPFLHGRVIDLSYAAAFRLGYAQAGSGEVDVELLTPELIAQMKGATAVAIAPAAPAAAAPAPVAQAPAPAPVPAPVAAPPVASPLPALTVQPSPSPQDIVAATPAVPPAPPPAPAPAAAPVAAVAPRVVPAPSPAAVRPASTVAPPVVSSASGPQYFIQLGAFSTRENALAAQQRMQAELGAVAQRSDVLLQDRLFKLQAGPFASRKQAEDAVARIKQQTGANVFFVVR